MHQYRLPLAEDTEKGWKPYDPLFGQTGSLELLGYHASVLSPGHCPHPPHTHPEEEILIVLDGEAEILIADSPRDKQPKLQRLTKHQAAYYPSEQHHTIRNVSTDPVTYLMLRWRSGKKDTKRPLSTQILDAAGARPGRSGHSLSVQVLTDGPTGLLSKLHVHVSELAPGHGYEPHIDAYDLAIIVLTGEIKILDSVTGPNSVVLIAAGEPHGIFNPTEEPARYLVVELHRNCKFTRGTPRVLRKSRKLMRRTIQLARRIASRVKAKFSGDST